MNTQPTGHKTLGDLRTEIARDERAIVLRMQRQTIDLLNELDVRAELTEPPYVSVEGWFLRVEHDRDTIGPVAYWVSELDLRSDTFRYIRGDAHARKYAIAALLDLVDDLNTRHLKG